ncbi:hypothetical protein BJX65DRAFT_268128 [Aspergillus insuetus]
MVPAGPQICPLLNLPERVLNLIVSHTHTIGVVSLSLTCKAILARGFDVYLSMTHSKRIRLQTIKTQQRYQQLCLRQMASLPRLRQTPAYRPSVLGSPREILEMALEKLGAKEIAGSARHQ